MAGFKAAFINELEKLYKKKKVVVAALISLLFIILGQLAITILRNGFGVRGTSSTEFTMLVLSVVVNTILPLFTALVTIDSFSNEFSHNTMKITITRPVSRLKFFTAKICAIMSFVLLNLVFVLIFSGLVGAIFNSNSVTFLDVVRVIVSYLVTLIPMTVLVLVIVFIANIFKSGTSVFFVSILLFLLFKGLGIIFPAYSSLFFTSMLDWYKLFITTNVSILRVLRQFLLMCSYDIILFTGAYYLFDKKEF